MKPLYQITNEYRKFFESINEEGDERTNEQLDEELKNMEGEYSKKIFANACYIKNMELKAAETEGAIEYLKQRLADINKHKNSLENIIEGRKKYIINCMNIAGFKKFDFPEFKITVRDNPGRLDAYDTTKIDNVFYKIEELRTLDKNAVKTLLKQGVEVPGCRLISNQSLIIK